jgi:hypothetical protein
VEIVVAMTILSIVLITLGGLMFDVARQTQKSAATTYRAAAVQQASAWIEGLPWDSITPSAGCAGYAVGPLTYDRCVSVIDTTISMKRITVVITPTGNLTARPDTLVMYRNLARARSPLQ